ncbi:MAG: hypothetical protein PHY31_09620 [Smithellaceae bacterium]|nr:hypothetical protein [Smithellaceae bacterium]
MHVTGKDAAAQPKDLWSESSFRKKSLSELAPMDGEAILYFLPWLLGIKHTSFPGFIKEPKNSFLRSWQWAGEGCPERRADLQERLSV